MIASVKQSHVKNPRDPNSPTKYAMFDLEDVEGAIRSILWPTDYVNFGQYVLPDAVVVAQGRLDYRGGDEANLIIDKLVPIDALSSNMSYGIKIMIDQNVHPDDALKTAYEIIRAYPGPKQLEIDLILKDGMRVQLKSNRGIEINDQIQTRLGDLLGKTAVEPLIDRKALSAKAEPKKYGYAKT